MELNQYSTVAHISHGKTYFLTAKLTFPLAKIVVNL